MPTSLPSSSDFFHASLTRMSLVLLVVLFVVLVRRICLARAQYARLPPGPKSSWFGRVDLPKEYQWLTYAKWKALYGRVVSLFIPYCRVR